jgi:hypothetical protein
MRPILPVNYQLTKALTKAHEPPHKNFKPYNKRHKLGYYSKPTDLPGDTRSRARLSKIKVTLPTLKLP